MLYIEQEKIYIESKIEVTWIDASLLALKLNVNQKFFDYSPLELSSYKNELVCCLAV